MRPALAACLAVLLLAGCAGPFEEDEARGDFERMDDFSLVLVGEGLLTAGPASADAGEGAAEREAAPLPALEDGLGVPDQPAPAAEEAAALRPAVARAVVAALRNAPQAIERNTAQANQALASEQPRSAAPALQRLSRLERNLAARLEAIESAPAPVATLAGHCLRAANAARDLRTALRAGNTEQAQRALARYRAQATAANRVIATFGLDGWPPERKLFP